MTEKAFPGLKNFKVQWLATVLIFFLMYATVRYIVFKGVEMIHFPVYIINKVCSVSGVFFIALSYASGRIKWPFFHESEKHLHFVKFAGLSGFSLVAMHAFLSMIILTPAYFPKLFHGEMMNFKGEFTVLMGVLSLFFFSIPAITSIPQMQDALGLRRWKTRQRIGYAGLCTTLLHSGVMGFSSWMEVHKWPGYLPPITMLGAVFATTPLVLKFLLKDSDTYSDK